MKYFLYITVGFFIPFITFAAVGTMTTYGGTGAWPEGIAFDGTNMWTANYSGNSVTKVSPTGAMTTYGGTGAGPYAIAFDGTNMWTANFWGNSVTKVSPTGAMTTYGGTGAVPSGIAFDGTNMWTANGGIGDNSVTKVSPTGVMTTYSGTGDRPNAIAFDGTNMWTANQGDVTKVSPTGVMTTYGGTGLGTSGIAFDGTNMWTTNNSAATVSKISPTGAVTTYRIGSSTSGPFPMGIAFDGTNMWTANIWNNSVTKVSPTGAVVTYTGTGGYPSSIAFDGTNMWTANRLNSVTKIGAVDSVGTITTTANIAAASWTITGPATITGFGLLQSSLSQPVGTYTITWDAVPGYAAPASESLTLLPGATISFNGIYAPLTALPIVIAPTVASITSVGATLGANVTFLGIPAAISARGTCFGTTAAPTTNCLDEGGSTTGVFAHARTGMTSGTLYYYRGYATNLTGTGYSPDGIFTTTAVVNGTCGSSNLSIFSAAPTINLCSTGVTTAITGTGPWFWGCNGSGGGINASCQAFTNVIAGSCGTANGTTVATAPTLNLCIYTSAAPVVTGVGPWNWKCFGSNGGADASCAAAKISCGDGICSVTETPRNCPQDCSPKYQQF